MVFQTHPSNKYPPRLPSQPPPPQHHAAAAGRKQSRKGQRPLMKQPAATTTTTVKSSSPSPTSLLLVPASPLFYESPDLLLRDLPPLPSLDAPDWDPLSSFLDPPPPSLDPLLRAALALDSGDRSLAFSILASYFPSSSGPPIHRSAFYFKDALLGNLTPAAALTPLTVVAKIAALRSLHDLSPVPRFTSFTANQAILESLEPFSSALHLVDFDLGLGGHWSSLLRDLATRPSPPPLVHLSAVAPAGPSLESTLAAENLREFAASLGIRLSVEVVTAQAEVRVVNGEVVAVLFTPAVAADGLAGFMRAVGSRVAVMVDGEPWLGWTAEEEGMRGRVSAGVEWYAAVMEAVEAAVGAVGCGEDEVARVERAVLAERVAKAVSGCFGARRWWDAMEAAGMRAVGMSEFTEAQARWLARGAAVDGYQVARRDGGLVLRWHGVDMAATYAWRRC